MANAIVYFATKDTINLVKMNWSNANGVYESKPPKHSFDTIVICLTYNIDFGDDEFEKSVKRIDLPFWAIKMFNETQIPCQYLAKAMLEYFNELKKYDSVLYLDERYFLDHGEIQTIFDNTKSRTDFSIGALTLTDTSYIPNFKSISAILYRSGKTLSMFSKIYFPVLMLYKPKKIPVAAAEQYDSLYVIRDFANYVLRELQLINRESAPFSFTFLQTFDMIFSNLIFKFMPIDYAIDNFSSSFLNDHRKIPVYLALKTNELSDIAEKNEKENIVTEKKNDLTGNVTEDKPKSKTKSNSDNNQKPQTKLKKAKSTANKAPKVIKKKLCKTAN